MLQHTLGRADCGHFKIASEKEWLVTNGLGGYASGTISGANTRRYHGLLVAALHPPVQRNVLVAKIDALAEYGNNTFPLFANEFGEGTIDPHGYRRLILFNEYFHGDNGAGLGAGHQTGWTGLVAKLIQQSGGQS